jgi:hypothetical protein
MNEMGRVLFAHTSPIYVEINDRKVFHRDTAQKLLAEMQASVATITAKGVFNNDGERESVLKIYRDGIGHLRERLGQ